MCVYGSQHTGIGSTAAAAVVECVCLGAAAACVSVHICVCVCADCCAPVHRYPFELTDHG